MMVNFTYTCWKWQFFNKNISQGSVATRLRCGGILIITVLQIYRWVRQWKNFENRLRSDRVTVMSLVSSFLGGTVRVQILKNF